MAHISLNLRFTHCLALKKRSSSLRGMKDFNTLPRIIGNTALPNFSLDFLLPFFQEFWNIQYKRINFRCRDIDILFFFYWSYHHLVIHYNLSKKVLRFSLVLSRVVEWAHCFLFYFLKYYCMVYSSFAWWSIFLIKLFLLIFFFLYISSYLNCTVFYWKIWFSYLIILLSTCICNKDLIDLWFNYLSFFML